MQKDVRSIYIKGFRLKLTTEKGIFGIKLLYLHAKNCICILFNE